MNSDTTQNPARCVQPACSASLQARFCYDKPHSWELEDGEKLLEILARELPDDEVADVWMGGFMEIKVELKRPEDFEAEKARVEAVVQRCWLNR